MLLAHCPKNDLRHQGGENSIENKVGHGIPGKVGGVSE